MRCAEYALGRRFDLVLDPGEDLVAALAELASREGLREAVVAAGLGGFGRFALSFAQRGPGGPDRLDWDGVVLQLAGVQGFVSDGESRVYAAITAEGTGPLTWAGRVETGSERLFYCEMMVLELLPAPPAAEA